MPVYPITSKENSRRLRAAVHRVFLEVWDPIRISDELNAQDEYDPHLGGMVELLMSAASDLQIKRYLDECVAHMGMDGSRRSLADVIATLRVIPLAEQA